MCMPVGHGEFPDGHIKQDTRKEWGFTLLSTAKVITKLYRNPE